MPRSTVVCLLVLLLHADGAAGLRAANRRGIIAAWAASITVSALPSTSRAISARTGLVSTAHLDARPSSTQLSSHPPKILPCVQASVFTGEYDDPNHPGCLRSIKVEGATMGPDGRRNRKPQAIVKGVDGNSCSSAPELGEVWRLVGEVNEIPPSRGEEREIPATIKIDFSPKGGPKDLVGKWEDVGSGRIVFPDGNAWTKVPKGTPDRRPKNLKTLNSDE